jgi:hypothetical protein
MSIYDMDIYESRVNAIWKLPYRNLRMVRENETFFHTLDKFQASSDVISNIIWISLPSMTLKSDAKGFKFSHDCFLNNLIFSNEQVRENQTRNKSMII